MTHFFSKALQGIIAALLVTDSMAAVPENVTEFLRNEEFSITEDGFLPSKTLTTLDFIRSVTGNWREVLKEMPGLAPDGRQQSLLVVACEFLSPPEYVEFISTLCDLRAQGKVVPEAVRFVLWASMAKSGFLAYNFDQPEVTTVIGRLEDQLSKDYPGEWKEFFTDLRSGKMKSFVTEERTRIGDRLPEPFANYDETPYSKLTGGSVKNDMQLIATEPVEAVASLASTNRTRWSLVVASVVILSSIVASVVVLRRLKRFYRKKKNS